ncbi:chemotaxis protein CheB [Cupriavidus oxalaticus]|uniref:chemotaxis protein CheB n=1 Tax=Cupriavidus oxalaticus TaxID=96344 RepID=UPI00316D59A0
MKRDTIVLGTSSGGVDALRDIAAGLPPDLDATVLAVLHIGANPSMQMAHLTYPRSDGQES